MTPAPPAIKRPHWTSGRAAYTILEICLVLFIVALIVGATIPFTGGLIAEQKMREPARQIELLARTARHLATLQQRSYVLILNADHVVLQPYNPVAPTDPFQIDSSTTSTDSSTTTLVSTNQATITTTFSTTTNSLSTNNTTASFPTSDDSSATPYTLRDPVTQEYDLPADITFTVRGWQDKDWTPPTDRVWIFPPTGLCEPLQLRFSKGEAYIEHTYDPLTGSVKTENSYLP